jgi:hypothetical protein
MITVNTALVYSMNDEIFYKIYLTIPFFLKKSCVGIMWTVIAPKIPATLVDCLWQATDFGQIRPIKNQLINKYYLVN